MPVSGPSPEVSAHAGLVDPEDCLQRALRGLSFLRMSCMSRACLRRSLHRFPRSDILDSSSRNSGMSPEVVAKQRHVAGGRRARPCPSQDMPELLPAAQGRRVQAGLV